MIPKTIHYCWFGDNPLPEDAVRYIESWKKYCPEYQIIEWNEKSFDINKVPYVREAYECKKWAFITDYVRLYALYNFGGIYMDTDVEVIKPLDRFLKEDAFSGFENVKSVPTGIMGSIQGQHVIGELLYAYNDRHFVDEGGKMDMSTNVETITDYFYRNGMRMDNTKQTISGFTMYPAEYFCPKNCRTLRLELTENTYTIHHFAGTWIDQKTNTRRIIKRFLGPSICDIIVKIMDNLGVK